jgi:hypothetical protein
MTMTYEAEQQIVKAFRSLPWYMFLVPALLSLLMALFAPAILADTRSEYGYWAVMWIVAKLGFFLWVLRQLLRYAIFKWAQKFRKPVNSYSHPAERIPARDHNVKPPYPNVEIISRKTIPHERRARPR